MAPWMSARAKGRSLSAPGTRACGPKHTPSFRGGVAACSLILKTIVSCVFLTFLKTFVKIPKNYYQISLVLAGSLSRPGYLNNFTRSQVTIRTRIIEG